MAAAKKFKVKIKNARGARPQAGAEFHLLLDKLAFKGFYGELTLYYQNGNIECARKTERVAKSDLLPPREREV